ncbi:MAG: spermidine/putrescine ABC transporter substrate-binding protein [Firmicutes bacterium]|nr:spermidine/putrescine ABC transporter substrate-binding protein [Bacillota bacterium]
MKQIIKKMILAAAAVSAAAALCSGCGGAGAQKTLNVFNWGEYIDESILADFTKETGIKINYTTFASNEDLYAKIKNGGVSYDVIVPSDYMLQRMIEENLLDKIDFNNVPNFSYIFDRFKNTSYDPTGEYSVPYMWGTLGILYNKKMTDGPVDSWSVLWDSKYAGSIFMYDSVKDAIAIAMFKLGLPVNSTDPADLAAAKNELIKQKPLVLAYVTDTVRDSMIGNEAALAVVYSGDAIYCMDNNPDLAYAVPKEGSNVWSDTLAIPKSCKNKAGAEAFINYLCKPEVALKNSEYIGYSTVNSAAFDMMDDSVKTDPAYWPTDDVFSRCVYYRYLGDFEKNYAEAWTEIFAAN